MDRACSGLGWFPGVDDNLSLCILVVLDNLSLELDFCLPSKVFTYIPTSHESIEVYAFRSK